MEGEYLAQARADRLGKVSCGKSCIRFTSLDGVDAGELGALMHDAVAATAAGTTVAPPPDRCGTGGPAERPPARSGGL